MTQFNEKDILYILQNASSDLSDKESYSNVCHEHHVDEPMPSVDKMETIVEKVREIIFPGYFGNTSLNPGTIQYYVRLGRCSAKGLQVRGHTENVMRPQDGIGIFGVRIETAHVVSHRLRYPASELTPI